jgi:hypothetical protein
MATLGKPSINQPGSLQLQAIQLLANNIRERFRNVDAAITALQTGTQSAATTAALLSLTNQVAALTRRVADLEAASDEFVQVQVDLVGETGTGWTATPDATEGRSFLIDATSEFVLEPIIEAVSGQTYTIVVSNIEGNDFSLDPSYLTPGNDLNIVADPDTYTLIVAVANLDIGSDTMTFLCLIAENLTFIETRLTEDDFTRVTEDDFIRISE